MGQLPGTTRTTAWRHVVRNRQHSQRQKTSGILRGLGQRRSQRPTKFSYSRIINALWVERWRYKKERGWMGFWESGVGQRGAGGAWRGVRARGARNGNRRMQQTGFEPAARRWRSGQPAHYASQGPSLMDLVFQAYIYVIICVEVQYATVTSVCCLRLNQMSNLPMRDLCVGRSGRGPGIVRRVGGLCPGGVRCGVSL